MSNTGTTHTRLQPSITNKASVLMQEKLGESLHICIYKENSINATARTRPETQKAKTKWHLGKLPLAPLIVEQSAGAKVW